MKIAIAQLNFHIGNFDSNVEKIVAAIHNAKRANAELIVFSELAVCGYPPRDFLEFDDFIDRCYHSIDIIAKECDTMAAIVGSPSYNTKGKGKHLFNSAFFIENKKVKKIVHKSLLPNYDVFDEYRYFEPNLTFECIQYKNKKIALTICEDLWNTSNNPLYTTNPMEELSKHHPDVVINIAASPFYYHQSDARKEILKNNALQYHLPIIYVNQIGAQTELLFDGGSMIIDRKGRIEEFDYFKEDFRMVEFKEDITIEKVKISNVQPIQKIHDALVMGIRDYFQKLGFQKAILGLSGGLDSAVTLALAVEALGSENVLALLMPSHFSSEHSVTDAKEIAETLHVSYEIISIENSFSSLEDTLKPYFKDLPFTIAEENMQARIRAIILMAFCNKFGYILLNTSNKSEAAVGYGTLYGDMCGGLSVIGDVYKTQVYELADFINKDQIIIPKNTIEKPPSAELKPDQKDSDSLPPYPILDKILYEYIEHCFGPDEIIQLGYDEQLVSIILKMVNINEYKRKQSPPILRISPKAFGMGRRLPIVGNYLS